MSAVRVAITAIRNIITKHIVAPYLVPENGCPLFSGIAFR